MNNKVCLIHQPLGLGDIFYTQKIATHFRNQGYEILWPVAPQYLWVGDYILDVNFVNVEADFPYKDVYSSNILEVVETEDKELVYVPLTSADRLFSSLPIMNSKYALVRLDADDWNSYFCFKRNRKKEGKLFYEVLGLTDETKYNFVNKMYGPAPNVNTYSAVSPNPHLPVVELRFVEGYTLFDWCKVIENASEIHIVDTSINYIIDKLELKASTLKCYLKEGDFTFRQVGHLFKTNWDFVNGTC